MIVDRGPGQTTIATGDSHFPLAEALAVRAGSLVQSLETGDLSPEIEGLTPTTIELLRWWFDPAACDARPVNFHQGQRDAILAVVIAHESLGTTSVQELFERLAPQAILESGRFGRVTSPRNRHPKYAAKMATGTGKTWVLAALMIWQMLNNRAAPDDERFTDEFLVVAPGLVVYDRLLDAFKGRIPSGLPASAGPPSRDFSTSDIATFRDIFIPPRHQDRVFAFVQNAVAEKHEIGTKVTGGGLIAITNWHVFLGKEDEAFADDELEREVESDDVIAPGLDIDERAAAASFVPLTPGMAAGNSLDALDRRFARGEALQRLIDLDRLLVFNDEAHHLGVAKAGSDIDVVEWQRGLDAIAAGKGRCFIQIDFSATPFVEQRGKRLYFDHIVVDFDLQAASRQGLVKALAIDKRSEIAALGNADLDFRVERDEHGNPFALSEGQRTMINAGLTKLKILEDQFAEHATDRHPKLMIMTEDTASSKLVVEYLASRGLDPDMDVLRVDSNRKGEVGREEWEVLRTRLFDIDRRPAPSVIVSVLMLREGFDVSSICVIVPLRAAASGILAEQVVGRGLRLMWRDADDAIQDLKRDTRERILRRQQPKNFLDVLFIVEHPRFQNLYDQLLGGDPIAELDDTDEGTPPTGDLETLSLREDYGKYDVEVPVILRDAEEEIVAPTLAASDIQPLPWPAEFLVSQVGGAGDRWASIHAETGTRFGDYRVDGGVMTAMGYRDFLARMVNRITHGLSRTFLGAHGGDNGQFGRDTRYPVLVAYRPQLVQVLDEYIRTVAFGSIFDPFADERWRVMFVMDVAETIAGNVSKALMENLDSVPVSDADVRHHLVSEVDSIRVRSSTAVTVANSIFERLPVSVVGGGTERDFIEFADRDGRVESIVKIDEYRHTFLHRPYFRADGMAAYYSPDYLVRTREAVFVVETKSQNMLAEENVQRKRRAAQTWVNRINELEPADRMGRYWSYVLLGSSALETWISKGGGIIELLEHARLVGSTARPSTTLF